jgi:pimeloyl-ACP methyl ester carboxylesterase
MRRLALCWRWTLGAVAAAVLLAGCAALDTKERELIFRPDRSEARTPADYGLAFEEVWLTVPAAAGGDAREKVHGWWMPAAKGLAEPAAPAVLYLHGSRWNIGNQLFRIARWHAMGYSVLAIDYRGFGRSDGDLPSEQQAYADAQAGWQWLVARQPDARKRFIFGHSLGGAIAIDLAARQPEAAGLVVESTFTSIPDMVQHLPYGWLPLQPLVTQRFDSASKIASIRLPVLFIHGGADRYVPPSMSERLHALAPEPKRLVIVPDAGHSNTAWRHFDQYRAAIEAFASSVVPGAVAPAPVAAPLVRGARVAAAP